MRMTGDMSEKYFSAVEEYKNAVQQKEKSEDRGEKENRTENMKHKIRRIVQYLIQIE